MHFTLNNKESAANQGHRSSRDQISDALDRKMAGKSLSPERLDNAPLESLRMAELDPADIAFNRRQRGEDYRLGDSLGRKIIESFRASDLARTEVLVERWRAQIENARGWDSAYTEHYLNSIADKSLYARYKLNVISSESGFTGFVIPPILNHALQGMRTILGIASGSTYRAPASLTHLSNNDIARALFDYQTNFETNREKYLQICREQVFTPSQRLIEKAVDSGKLPISRERVERVLGSLKVILTSGIDHVPGYNSKFEPGLYVGSERTIVFPLQTPHDALHVTTHENLHALSGHTVVYSKNKASGEMFGHVEKVGLSFSILRPHATIGDPTDLVFSAVHRFAWLNEAMTERLALEVDNAEDRKVYESERDLLLLLQTAGRSYIPDQFFREAYFEDHTEGPQKLAKWKTMNHAINDAFCPGFLTMLDVFISRHGQYEAISLIREGWRKLPEIVREERRQNAGAKASQTVGLA